MLIKKIAAMVVSSDHKNRGNKITNESPIYEMFILIFFPFPWNDASGQVARVQTAPQCSGCFKSYSGTHPLLTNDQVTSFMENSHRNVISGRFSCIFQAQWSIFAVGNKEKPASYFTSKLSKFTKSLGHVDTYRPQSKNCFLSFKILPICVFFVTNNLRCKKELS